MDYPLPPNENERLAALSQLGILDTDPDASFDRITKLAKDIFDVSSAGVSLIDRNRQWFKSMCGWDVEETDRETSLCTYTILDDRVMVVEDAAEDPRFQDNPYVTAEYVRFYAGAPLSVGENSLRIGTLCLIDDQPRSFGPQQQERLSTLGEMVVDLLEAHRTTHQVGYLTSALEEARDAVVITEAAPLDRPGPRIVWTNEAFSRMTGYESGELVGKTPRVLQGPETSQTVLNKVRSALENRRPVHAETVNYRKDGTPYVVAWHIAPVHDDNEELTHWVSVQRDVTDERRRKEQLRHKANHDALTGLPNREIIQKTIREFVNSCALEDEKRGALLYIDLDAFKPVNDEFGHQVGDRVLERVAQRLRDVVRTEDTVGRIGGDEFVVCLERAQSTEEVRDIAERIYDTVAEPFALDPCDVQVTASIGATLELSDYESADEALHAADGAMYEAKESSSRKVVLRQCPQETASARVA